VAEINRQGGDPTRVVGRRIFGGFLEGIIDSVLFAGLFGLLGITYEVSPAYTPFPTNVGDEGAQLTVFFLVYLLYFLGTKVVPLGLWGWTPGMICVGVRCVRWDGRPPGLVRALVRSLFFSFYAQFGCLMWITAPLPMFFSKGHKGFQDMIAGTFVVDNQWFGHMVIVTSDGVAAGPMSVRREEAEKLLRAEGVAVPSLGARLPPNAKSGNPFLDKELDTYVVWNARESRFLAFDKSTGSWEPLD
jgi:uncharacterized RDD family membrane protein YckC